jgi:phospholipid transport system substrate-binding protein
MNAHKNPSPCFKPLPALVLGVLLAVLVTGAYGAQPGPAVTAVPTSATDAVQNPQALMDEVTDRLLRELQAQRPALKKDPSKVFALVDSLLLPHFDVDYAGRLVLGPAYRTATPEQRSRFTQALYRSLLKTYAGAVIDFTADRMKLLPFRPDATPDTATIRSEIRRDDGTRVPVNYVMHRTPNGWQVWNVEIEGISYIRNYRKDIGAEIQQKGLDAVIARLERDAAQNGAGIRPAAAPVK